MSRIRFMLAATLLFGLPSAARSVSPPSETAATDKTVSVLVDSIRANRKALVAVNLGLTADEATKFWPIYDRYRQEMNAIGDRMVAAIEDYIAHYSDLSNEKALQILDTYLAAEADRDKVRRTYVDEFSKVLPGRTVARFYQLENKMDALLRYDLAKTIPVVESSSAPAK